MAFSQRIQALSLPAGADLSADQYMFVDLIAGVLAIPSAAGARVVGVLQDKPNVAGDPGEVAMPGCITKLVAGAAFNKGAALQSDALGRGITAVSGKYVAAIALQAATAAGQIVSAVLVPSYLVP